MVFNIAIKYFEVYISALNTGFDLYYYNDKTNDFDIFKGNYKYIQDAQNAATREYYTKNPIYFNR